jgi:hypothetical protein
VTVKGHDFAPGRGNTTVSFGRIRALHVICRSAGRCTLSTPPRTPGTIHVAVTVKTLSSIGGSGTRYNYQRG